MAVGIKKRERMRERWRGGYYKRDVEKERERWRGGRMKEMERKRKKR